MKVVDNVIRRLQSHVMYSVSHNVLSRDKWFQLYNSSSIFWYSPKGLSKLILITLVLFTAIRPTILNKLTLNHFKDDRLDLIYYGELLESSEMHV